MCVMLIDIDNVANNHDVPLFKKRLKVLNNRFVFIQFCALRCLKRHKVFRTVHVLR